MTLYHGTGFMVKAGKYDVDKIDDRRAGFPSTGKH